MEIRLYDFYTVPRVTFVMFQCRIETLKIYIGNGGLKKGQSLNVNEIEDYMHVNVGRVRHKGG